MTRKKNREMDELAWSCCENGDADGLARALAQGAAPNGCSGDGITLAMLASHLGHVDCLSRIIGCGARLRSNDRINFDPAYLAAMAGHEDCLELLIEAGARLKEAGSEGESVAYWAVKHGMRSAFPKLAKAGAPLDRSGFSTERPCVLAARLGHLWAIEAMHQAGCPLEEDKDCAMSSSPMIEAAARGHIGIVKFLSERRIGLEYDVSHHGGALSAAAAGGHEECLAVLIEAGARNCDVDFRNKAGGVGVSPLWAAAHGGHVGCVEMLLASGAPALLRPGQFSSQAERVKADAAIDAAKERLALKEVARSGAKGVGKTRRLAI